MTYDKRAPVFTMGKNRRSDIFDCASKHGFSYEDADRIASDLPHVWDGMDGLHKAFWGYIRNARNRARLSESGQEHALRMIEKADT